MKTNWLKGLFLIGIFFLYLLPPVDTDWGWHLFYGRHIFETRSVIRTNQTSFYLPNYQWAHCYSLHQLISYTLFHFFGFWGIALLGSLVMTTTFFFLSKTHPKKNLSLVISSLFLILISQPTTSLGYRSQLFSILGVSFLYYLILNSQKFSLKTAIGLAIVFGFWANLHGGFPLGISLLIFYTLERLGQGDKREVLNISLVIGLSLLATLINPFGWKIYQEIYRHSWYPLDRLIAEWVPPGKFHVLTLLLINSLVIITLITKKKAIKQLNKEKVPFLILSWVFFNFLAFKARRHLPFAGLASIQLILYLLPPLKVKKRAAVSVILFISLAAIVWRLTHFPDLGHDWDSICQLSRWTLPCQAAKYLKNQPDVCKNIFNTYEWGGYLTWQLPQRKLFVDGRMPAWPTPEGKSPYTVYLEILQTKPGFNEKLLRYGADCIFILPNTFLDLELKKDKSYPWKLIYQDPVSVIYQKQNEPAQGDDSSNRTHYHTKHQS